MMLPSGRGTRSFSSAPKHFFHEIDELRRTLHDDVRREGTKSLAQLDGLFCCRSRHCFFLQLESKLLPKLLSRHAAQAACYGKQFAHLRR